MKIDHLTLPEASVFIEKHHPTMDIALIGGLTDQNKQLFIAGKRVKVNHPDAQFGMLSRLPIDVLVELVRTLYNINLDKPLVRMTFWDVDSAPSTFTHVSVAVDGATTVNELYLDLAEALQWGVFASEMDTLGVTTSEALRALYALLRPHEDPHERLFPDLPLQRFNAELHPFERSRAYFILERY